MDLYAFDWPLLIWNIAMTVLTVFIGIFIYKLYRYISKKQ